MEQSLGTRLRTHREAREIPLAAVAAATKIKLRLLEGLERDDVSEWPEGIFRRSYIRAYAKAIGADPDDTCREFMALYPDSVIVPDRTIVWPDANSSTAPPRTLIPAFL